MARLLYAERFMNDAGRVWSPKIQTRLTSVLSMLETFPESGSPVTRASLVDEFGEDIRTCPANPFLLVYEYDQKRDAVMLYALLPQRTVR